MNNAGLSQKTSRPKGFRQTTATIAISRQALQGRGASQTVGAKDEQSHFLKFQHHLSPSLSPNEIGGEGEKTMGSIWPLTITCATDAQPFQAHKQPSASYSLSLPAKRGGRAREGELANIQCDK